MAPHQGDIRCCEKNGGEAEYFSLDYMIIKRYNESQYIKYI